MRTIWTALLAVVTLASSIAATTPEEPARRVPLPANVVIDAAIRDEVEELVALSPTLARQFAVVGAAPAKVEIRVSLARLPAFRRAEATISRYEAGFVAAQITLPPSADFAELLAHEIEHVVEQIEGVDLRAIARTGGATQDVSGIYETVRARDAGRAAAHEVEQALRAVQH